MRFIPSEKYNTVLREGKTWTIFTGKGQETRLRTLFALAGEGEGKEGKKGGGRAGKHEEMRGLGLVRAIRGR